MSSQDYVVHLFILSSLKNLFTQVQCRRQGTPSEGRRVPYPWWNSSSLALTKKNFFIVAVPVCEINVFRRLKPADEPLSLPPTTTAPSKSRSTLGSQKRRRERSSLSKEEYMNLFIFQKFFNLTSLSSRLRPSVRFRSEIVASVMKKTLKFNSLYNFSHLHIR